MNNAKNIFSVSLKSIAFAWETNRRLLLILIFLNLFQGSVVYLQFTSFSSIVDEIVKIKNGISDTRSLLSSCVIFGLSFLIPTLVSNLVSFLRTRFRLQQSVQLEL